uniref:acylglycerol lipase n=1 Tax=Salvator merianae TaxID=96440 RepID=A0A8D0DV80_SALMN
MGTWLRCLLCEGHFTSLPPDASSGHCSLQRALFATKNGIVTLETLPTVLTGDTNIVPLSFVFCPLFKRQRRGVKVKHTDHEGYRFSYFTRGEPGPRPSMLMLHGFSLNKDIWLNTIKMFPDDLHLICLDMPGHGKTTRLLGESYTAAAQAKRIHQFVECIGLNKTPFHLVGMSMGGMIAGVYAAQYPSEICSLTLLSPAGLKYPTESEFFRLLKELIQSKDPNDTTLVPVTKKHGKDLIKISFAESRYSLHDNMSKIKAPTQIIWGRDDKSQRSNLDVTGAGKSSSTLCMSPLLPQNMD